MVIVIRIVPLLPYSPDMKNVCSRKCVAICMPCGLDRSSAATGSGSNPGMGYFLRFMLESVQKSTYFQKKFRCSVQNLTDALSPVPTLAILGWFVFTTTSFFETWITYIYSGFGHAPFRQHLNSALHALLQKNESYSTTGSKQVTLAVPGIFLSSNGKFILFSTKREH